VLPLRSWWLPRRPPLPVGFDKARMPMMTVHEHPEGSARGWSAKDRVPPLGFNLAPGSAGTIREPNGPQLPRFLASLRRAAQRAGVDPARVAGASVARLADELIALPPERLRVRGEHHGGSQERHPRRRPHGPGRDPAGRRGPSRAHERGARRAEAQDAARGHRPPGPRAVRAGCHAGRSDFTQVLRDSGSGGGRERLPAPAEAAARECGGHRRLPSELPEHGLAHEIHELPALDGREVRRSTG